MKDWDAIARPVPDCPRCRALERERDAYLFHMEQMSIALELVLARYARVTAIQAAEQVLRESKA